jgi:hypothetical protein
MPPKSTAPPIMDAETLISRFVAQSGGTLVSDLLSKSPDIENADYLFRPDGLPPVVAELKCLTEDHGDLDYNKKIGVLYAEWIDRGLVPDHRGRSTIESEALPEECRAELFELIGRRLRKIVNKASRQIRLTKEHLGIPDAKGLLLLVNEGNYSLASDMILYLVGQTMKVTGQSIDSVIYFTVNMVSSVSITERNALLWVQTVHPQRDGIDVRFLTWLRDAWMEFHSKVLGERVPSFTFRDPEVLSRAKFLRPPTPDSYYADRRGRKFRCLKVVGDSITWLAMEVPRAEGPIHAVVSQNLRYIEHYSLITDATEIRRLTKIYKALRPRPTG